MNTAKRLTASVLTATALLATSTGTAIAAPVDPPTYQTQLDTALQNVKAAQQGKSLKFQSSTSYANVPVRDVTMLHNPDGSFRYIVIERGFKREVRCNANHVTCYITVDNGNTWQKNQIELVDSDYYLLDAYDIDKDNNTFDITENVYTETYTYGPNSEYPGETRTTVFTVRPDSYTYTFTDHVEAVGIWSLQVIPTVTVKMPRKNKIRGTWNSITHIIQLQPEARTD